MLAHPIRLGFRNTKAEDEFIRELRDAGLRGIEVFHSDHRPTDMERYAGIARKYSLASDRRVGLPRRGRSRRFPSAPALTEI